MLSTVAGAPFLVKEVQAAEGNLSLGVGLMFMLMVVTIFYVPLVLPLLLPGVAVDAWAIAKSLIMTMLIPIVLGLMYRSHSTKATLQWTLVSCSEFLTQRNPAQTLSRSFETGLPA